MNVTYPLLAVDVNQLWDSIGIQSTFRETPWWAWLAFAGMVFVGLAAGKTITTIFRIASERSLRGSRLRQRILIDSFGRPLGLLAFTMAAFVGVGFLRLHQQLRDLSWNIAKLLFITAAGWAAYNLVALIELQLFRLTAKTKSPLDDQLVPLVRKTLRIMLVIVLGLFVADNVFHADIKSFLAGLGIIGLAISLASQDTVKNFFGSVTIFVDQPFNLGDRIVLTGYEGVVEEIGFRSTKLRMTSGHVVQIPNSKIVDSTVENISRRKFIRRQFEVPLAAGLSIEQIEQAVQVAQRVLNDSEFAHFFDMERDPPRVAMEDYAAARPALRIIYWYTPAEQWGYQQHAQKLNLRLMRELAAAKLI
jgi:MscS family membrane protein